MTAIQLPLLLPAHRNQQLFSDYYLNTTLPHRADWQELMPVAAPILLQIKQIFEAYTPSDNEAQTEDGLIKPILAALGHSYEIQASLKTPDGTKKPDYIFYQNTTALNANKRKPLDDNLPKQGGIAVGDAKYWNRPLDSGLKAKGGDPFSNKNPSFQIAFYMQHSGVDWGILTNGCLWRLYHKDTAHKLDRYYEIDLPELLKSGDPARFLFFYAFFRRSAFDEHPLGLRALLRISTDFAHGISEDLKQQVYTALRHLAQGFLDYVPNQLQPDTSTLKIIYDHSLIVLYRLLFVLYAEARELLPLRESKRYHDFYSLDAIKREVARRSDGGEELLSTSATFWPRLRELFSIINVGSPPLKVATFNGGLFDPLRYPFLEEKSIGDARLLQAIDMLARVDRKFIDYRDLAERHLGTIYEGLLEHHLEPKSEGMWTIDVLDDKGERRSTGSYYTPDYIVKYIVDQTVGPALQQAITGLDDDAAKVNAVLSLNICDPAMGSGHFLVEATEYIARFLIDQTMAPGPDAQGEADLVYWKRRVAKNCIYGVDLNPLAVDLAKLSLWLTTVAKDRPLSFLDHHLRCGNTLIGTRISELSQGSVTAKPKSKRRRKATPSNQLSLFNNDAFRESMSSAVGSMSQIEDNAGTTIEEVKEQERIYADLQDNLHRKYGRLANLSVATHFGVVVDMSFWDVLADYASGRIMTAPRQFVIVLDEADRIAQERRFFHWELEFPEVFFDYQGSPRGNQSGFDAIVGNPPYANVEDLDVKEKQWLEHQDADFYNSKNDVLYHIMARAFKLINAQSLVGMIISRYLTEAHYADSFRQHLRKKTHLMHWIDFGNLELFQGINTRCVIFAGKSVADPDKVDTNKIMRVTRIDTWPNSHQSLFSVLSNDTVTEAVGITDIQMVQDALAESGSWVFTNDLESLLRQKIELISSRLGGEKGLCKIGMGWNTGLDKAFSIYDKDVSSFGEEKSFIYPVTKNGDIKRFSIQRRGLWWINTDSIENIDLTPKIKHHLEGFSSDLEKRYTVRASGSAWYEFAVVNMPEVFLSDEKIITPYKAPENRFAIDTERSLSSQDVYAIKLHDGSNYSHLYILALLNSRPMTFFYQRFYGRRKKIEFDYYSNLLEKIPIRSINFNTPATLRTERFQEAVLLYTTAQHNKLIPFVKARLSEQLEQSDVVHDILAYLAQQMRDLSNERYKLIENLLLDLEGLLTSSQLDTLNRLYTPPRLSASDNDVKQKRYEQTMTNARAHLGELAKYPLELRTDIGLLNEEQWKWLIKERLKTVSNMAELVRVYRNRPPAIATTDQRITQADNLIDQIVYILYGLDDKEIHTIEKMTRLSSKQV